MKEKFRIRIKNRIYISYLTSYLIIGLIPLFLSLVGYKLCEETVVDEIKVAQDSILSQLQNALDRNIESVINAGQILAGNERVISLGREEVFSSQSHLELQKLKDELIMQLDKLDICDDITVYFEKTGAFLTNNGVYQKELADLYYQNSQMREEDIGRILNTGGLRGYVIGENTEGRSEIYFVENLYSFNFKEKSAVIFLKVPWENIQELGMVVEAGSLYWQNSDNEILLVNGGGLPEKIPSFDVLETEGELLYAGEGREKSISSFRSSECYDWKYCISMREREYFAVLNRMKLVIGIQMVLLLSVAILLALYYSNQRYVPVERILDAIRKNQRSGKAIQDFKDVERYIDGLCRENVKLTDSWKKAQESMVGEIITGYIKGWNVDTAMVQETLLQKEFSLDNGYCVFLITLRDINECKLFLHDKAREERTQHQEMELLEFVFRNIFEEIVQSVHKGILLQLDGNYLYIVPVPEEKQEAVCSDMKKCSEAYGSYLNLNLFIGGSMRHETVEELSKAYNEAVQVLAYQTFWGNSSEVISLYEADYMENESWAEEGAMTGYHRHLYNLMQVGQYSQAEELLNEIMDNMFVRDMRYTKINQYRMSGLMNSVCMMLTELLGRNDEEFLKTLRPMERLMSENSIDSARRTMLEIFDDITAHLKQCMEEEKPKWVKETIQEIEENFRDMNLGLAALSEKHDLNLAYMGRTFKQYTGYSVQDYIHRVRIRECKKLLSQGMSVKDAAEQIGYIDAKTLIRIFKKQEGITPGQFKESLD